MSVTPLRPSTPLELVGWEKETDLRTVSHSAKWLIAQTTKLYKLKNGQAILYSNKAEDRFRAVQLINGLPVVILFPIDETYALRRRLYLEIASWLVATYKVPARIKRDLHEVFVQEEYQEAASG